MAQRRGAGDRTGTSGSAPRRAVLIGLGVALAVRPAAAADFAYRGWRIDADAIHGELAPALVRALQAQVDLVESLAIKPDIKAFFRDMSIKIEPGIDALGFAGLYHLHRRRQSWSRSHRGGSTNHIDLGTRPAAPDDPVLLYFLLLAYLDWRVPEGVDNPEIAAFFEQARISGAFPNRARMLESPQAFFACCASVALWGRAPVEPLERARLREKLPRFYGWIERAFYPGG